MNRQTLVLSLCCAAGAVGMFLLLVLPATVHYREDTPDTYRCAAVLQVPPTGDAYPDIYQKFDRTRAGNNADIEDDRRRLKDRDGPDEIADHCSRYRDRRTGFALLLAVPTCLLGSAVITRRGR